MEKLVFKFDPENVDQIEKAKGGQHIANYLQDLSISNILLFMMKALPNDRGGIGMTRNEAMAVLKEQLSERDTSDILMDIMEGLTSEGFLDRGLDLETLRTAKKAQSEKIMSIVNN